MIRLAKPYFNNNEINAVKETLKSGWVAGQGPKGKELSEYIKKMTNNKFAIPVNNCTAGLHLSLLAIGIEPGDEVLVSDYTFPAAGHSVMFCGAKPRFIDVSLKTYNIKPDLIKDKINDKTKAIIVVHQFGQMAEMDEIVNVANSQNLKVIEDSACAMGAKYKGRPAGSFGDITVFSFHGRKNVTSGEGGIVVTKRSDYANIIESLSCFGMESAYKRQQDFSIPSFNKLGYNYKLSDINAAIVLEQLKKYPKVLEKKRILVSFYNKLLNKNKLVNIPIEQKYNYHVYQTYAILLDKKIDRNKLILSLRDEGIQTQIGTYASHIQPVYNSDDKCPNSLHLFKQSLALPLYYEMRMIDVDFVVERLHYHLKKQMGES